VLVTVKISNSKVRVPSGSRASIYANGIIGSKYIEIRLPDKSGKKALGENDLIAGEPTYRPELLVEQLSKQANELDIARLQNTMIAEMQRVGRAADGATAVYGRIGRAADGASMLYGRIGHAADQASALSSRLGGISSSATPVLGKIGKAADNTTALVNRLGSTAEKTNKLEDQLMGLAQDLSKKTNNELNQLLSKTFCMEDRVTALADELNLRSKTDLKGALITTKCAMGQTAIVGKQLSQIMDKRAPILQLLFGRPGHLKAPVVCPTQIAVPETAATESIKEKAIIIDTK
jgi:ABC-type transporter Mla subunit MlaD